MKYKASIEFKGISVTVDKKKVEVPGDITVNAEGEYSWLDMLVFGWLLKMLNK